jgi:chloramphenicol-sensitive protein RarD
MDYTVVGFLQFLSPTLVFLLGLLWFHEALKPAQLACFIAIWCAMALFIWDLFRARPGQTLAEEAPG